MVVMLQPYHVSCTLQIDELGMRFSFFFWDAIPVRGISYRTVFFLLLVFVELFFKTSSKDTNHDDDDDDDEASQRNQLKQYNTKDFLH